MADLRSAFKRPDSSALLRAAVLLIIGFLPCTLLGIPGAVTVLAIGWAVAATLYAAWGMPALALLVGGAVGLARMLPMNLAWLPGVWAVAGGIGILVPEAQHFRRAMRWGGLAAVVVCAVLGALALRYPGETAVGVAQEMIEAIAANTQRDAILLSAYQGGLASVDPALLPSLQRPAGEYSALPGSVYAMFQQPQLSETAAMELLYSLRTTLEMLFRMYVPQLIVSFIGLTVALCVVVPDEWLRRRGSNDNPLPQLDTWKLPPRMATVAICGLLFSFVPYLLGGTTLSYAVTLCTGAATWAFMAQGAGLLAHLLKKHGTSRNMRYTIALALAVLLPQVLQIMGIIDQITSLRKSSDTEV